MLRLKTKKKNGILWGIGATLTAVAIFGTVVYNSAQSTYAANESITGGDPVTGRVNQQIAISDLSIGGTGNDTIPVKLQVTEGFLYMSTTTGLTFDGATGGTTLNFTGTRTNVNAALATLHYSGTTVGSQTLTVSLADENTIFNPDNGHVYQYIPNNLTWYDARDEAAGLSYQGVSGYLATITSQDENDFIKERLNGDAWLGASDDEEYMNEGTWSWVAGPEAGTNFYSGEGNDGSGGGSAVDGAYTNWAGPDNEPNNAGDEDCMETYIADGTWNDLPCITMGVNGYVVEYGDDETTPSGIPATDVSITTTAAVFAGGDGTPEEPYQITDCERLQDANQDLSASYVLNNDIDCTDTPNWNGGQGFVPIGSNVSPFTGSILGAGHSVDGLTQIRADDDPDTNSGNDLPNNQERVGLIGSGSNMTITQLHLTNAKIKGYGYVGGLVGFMSNGTIEDSTVNEGLDESDDTSCDPGYCVWARYGVYGGGLVGWMVGGSIDGSKVGGLVKGSGNVIGGLVGHMEGSAEITNSESTAEIDGGASIGGVVGEIFDNSSLYRVFATGNVTAKVADEVGKVGWWAGGLVGYGSNASISQSYATGDVHADYAFAGGLGGELHGSVIADSYATGNVTSDGSTAGGLLGASDNNIIARVYASGGVAVDYSAGGLIGASNADAIDDAFTAGPVTGLDDVGSFAGSQGSLTMSQAYYDVTATGEASCVDGGAASGCIEVNEANSEPEYLIDYINAPFTQSESPVWNRDSIWYFDGDNYPVLRMGTNNSPSARPFHDDNDGVSAAIENAGPNGGDGNNDGTQDSEQANVVSFVNPVTGKYVTIEVDDACSFTAATSAAAPVGGDDNYSYPFGLLNYTLDCGTPGYSTDVAIYYHNLSNANGLVARKYNSTTNIYATIPGVVIDGVNPVKVTYTVEDGSSLDEDGTPNGIIVDPVGLGAPLAATPTSPSDSDLIGAPNTGLESGDPKVFAMSAIAGIVLLSGAAVAVRRVSKKHGEK